MRSCEHSHKECADCFKERIGSVGVAASATPSRYISRSRTSPTKGVQVKNSWEKGTAKDSRGMPYLDKYGNAVPIKKYTETRHDYRSNETIDVSTHKD